MTDIRYIASVLSTEDILCQLAEEASELAQAALKLRRALTGTNPTPLPEGAAIDMLFEELTDVLIAKEVYVTAYANDKRHFSDPERYIRTIADVKIRRWVERLKEKKVDDGETIYKD